MNTCDELFPAFAPAAPRPITKRSVRLYLEIDAAVRRLQALRPNDDRFDCEFAVLLAFADREGVTLAEIEDIWLREDAEWARTVDALLTPSMPVPAEFAA